MAVLTPTVLTANTAQVITAASGTPIVAGATDTIVYPKDGILVIKIESSNDATSASVAASDFGVAAGQGAVTYAATNGVSSLFVVGSSSRLSQSAGTGISLTWATSSAGYITALNVPTSMDA
jgi:hypothetical protein